MSHEPIQPLLRDYVGDAERAHQFFQNEVRDSRGKPGAVLAQLELMQFYAEAFAGMVRLLSGGMAGSTRQADALEEAVRGRTAYWEWQRRPTSLLSPLELYQMQSCWERLLRLVRLT